MWTDRFARAISVEEITIALAFGEMRRVLLTRGAMDRVPYRNPRLDGISVSDRVWARAGLGGAALGVDTSACPTNGDELDQLLAAVAGERTGAY
jgi:hypothetical protein